MRAKRFISVILSLLIVCSSFAGLTVFADEVSTHTYTVVGDATFLSALWTPNNPDEDLSLQADGTYKITYKNVAESDLYTVKVVEDHSWDNSFGKALGDNSSIEFSVPKDNSTVEIILTLQGTKEKEIDGVLTTVNDGYVTILVNGEAAPSKVNPEYYIAGDPGLCNGVLWNQAAPENKMTDNGDGSYEITITGVQPKSDGTPYEYKVTTNGSWDPAYGYYGLIELGGANVQLMITEADSTVKIVLTKDLFVQAYVNGLKVSPEPVLPTPAPPFTTNEKGETSGITYGGGFFDPPQDVECNRYFFQIPVNFVDNEGKVHNWKTFTNAAATCYWWDGEYACESWQKSYQMRPSGLDNIYYIDVPKKVGTIIISNGIDGGPLPVEGEEPGPNWGKNCQSVFIGAEYYDPGENPNYPYGTTSFDNMIYIVDVNNVSYNEHSKAPTYGGEWRYLHADGSIDYTSGTIYKPEGIKVKADIDDISLTVDESVKVNATVTGGDIGYTVEWASSDTSVAVVDQNGTITAKGLGTAEITVKAQNPDSELNFSIDKIIVTVTMKEQTISVSQTSYTKTFGDNPFSLNAKAETALSYVSNNTSVADVSSDGTVTINGAGKATITITAEETEDYNSATATVEITVNKASQKVSVAEKEYELTYGAKPFNLGAKADTTLTYVSNNLNVAEVSSDGTVTINGAGTANIIIMGEETDNYTSAITTVKIIVKKTSQEITGFEPKYEVTFGDKPFSLNAKAETALLYASDNTSVAEVSSNGTVTIKNSGIASIMIIAKETANYNSTTATVKIIVNKTSPKITGFETNYNVKFGDNPFSLNAKAETALSYTSDNTSVVEVSADGTVTIKGVGTATITITADETENYNSATATVKITVAKATQRVTGVKTQYVTSAGKSFILKPKAKTKLTYTSSNKNVAVVSSTGKVTVKAGGYAYITVKASENGNYKSAYVKTKIISAPRDFTSKDISKVKKTGKTTAKITWKSLAGAKGYTVQLATNKSYKGAKTVKNSKNTATLTGLKKGKIYYVRISAYTKISGKNYSNKWYTVKFKM